MTNTDIQSTSGPSQLEELISTVVDGGYCIGCGACAAIDESPIQIKFDKYQRLQATVNSSIDKSLYNQPFLEVCPFSDKSQNEYEIGKELFGGAHFDDKIGYYLKTYAGYVNEGEFRNSGSSGGMGSWMAYTLLNEGLVDGVIQVQKNSPDAEDGRLFKYQLSMSASDIKGSAKSRYYPIELSDMLREIKRLDGKYAIVGVPCFIKSVRLSMKHDEVLRERIKFCIGLICGHLKSAGFAQMLGWQCDISPSSLKEIDFRTKVEGKRANHYCVTVKGDVDGKEETRVSSPVNNMYGTNWGLGYFKYKACDFCDDVVAETADLTIGDAWLPQYVQDHLGTNVIVVRNQLLQNIIERAASEHRLQLDDISAKDVAASQNSGFEHRRNGLAYRLYLTDKTGVWRPQKRVKPSHRLLSTRIKKRQKCRIELARQSHLAFQNAIERNSFEMFKQEMKPLVDSYEKLYKRTLMEKVKTKLRSLINRL